MESNPKTSRPISFWTALAVFLLLLFLVVSFTAGLGSSPHIPLLLACTAAAIVGACHHFSWK